MPESMNFPHIFAAGGIVVHHDPEPRIGVVQLRKNKAWVLPKGKLSRKESALDAARREVLEETGREVSVHEFIGTITYRSRGKPKVVQFWRMQVTEGPAHKLMPDVRAVEWLPLAEAVDRLTRPHERDFLENVGEIVLRAAEKDGRPRAVKTRRRTQRARLAKPAKPAAPGPAAAEPAVTHVPPAPVETVIQAEPIVAPAPTTLANETALPALAREAPVAQWPISPRRTSLQRKLLDRLFGYRKRRSN